MVNGVAQTVLLLSVGGTNFARSLIHLEAAQYMTIQTKIMGGNSRVLEHADENTTGNDVPLAGLLFCRDVDHINYGDGVVQHAMDDGKLGRINGIRHNLGRPH